MCTIRRFSVEGHKYTIGFVEKCMIGLSCMWCVYAKYHDYQQTQYLCVTYNTCFLCIPFALHLAPRIWLKRNTDYWMRLHRCGSCNKPTNFVGQSKWMSHGDVQYKKKWGERRRARERDAFGTCEHITAHSLERSPLIDEKFCYCWWHCATPTKCVIWAFCTQATEL